MLKSIRRRLRKAKFFTDLTRYSSTLEVPLPTHIQVEPTTRCNALCGSCSRSSLANNQLKNDLTLETLERILETFPDLKSIRLLGLGEPFLHPEFEEILMRLRERDIKIWLISNGSLLANDRIRRLLHTYIDDVGFSIDSADPAEFRALRPMGRIGLSEIVTGMRQLIAERDAGKSNLLIGVNAAISHQNCTSLAPIGNLCIDLGVDYLSVAAIENWLIEGDPGYQESANFSIASSKHAPIIDKYVAQVRRRLLMRGIILGYKTPKPRIGKCHWPFKSLHVATDGTVTPCCIRTQPTTHGMFNLLEDKPFEAFWNGEDYQKLRRAHMEGDASNSMCGNCPY